ncbi:Ig-like domain-containing protein [Sphaerotilus sp.]|uniref:Ig-like domain-containing protein n=1 Tax=Sphaerotilus sp. TaxID=2093942 RepID=UPI00286DECFB|nr:Ig-like domain-containing protein [Sphaerotilus sp.]
MFGRLLFLVLWLLVAPLHAQTMLVPAGSSWKYLDNGTDQGTVWRAPSYDDSAWKSGAAQLGYGDGDETTVIGYGPSSTAKYITSYFRRSFQVTNAGAISALPLRVKRDDGIVLYLNGVEVWRSNMPAGTPLYSTLASGAADDDGATWQTATLSTAALVTGTNVLAAEVHQVGGDSSDLSFDLELQGTAAGSVAITRGPYLQIGTPGGVQLRWRTNAASDGVVRYGTALTALTSVAVEATTGTMEHAVNLSGLAANTRYYYSVGTSAATLAAASDTQYFMTSPPSGTGRSTRVWVIGDAGTGNTAQTAVRNAYEAYTGTRHTDLWLQLGDNVYETGTDAEYQSRMFDVYQGMLRKSVTWPTIGNHDTAGATTVSSSLPYFNVFSFPTQGQAGGVASGTKSYYAFDFGNIHFICLDSMTSSRAPGSAMLTWLQSDLAANTKAWTIAYWHHPPYSKGPADSDIDTPLIEMRTNVLPILEAYGVDLVLSGHSHVYERSYLIDSHYGLSSTLTTAMKKNGGSGRPAETGAYRKPLGSVPHQGAVYSVVGSSGGADTGPLNHPAMFISLSVAGSMVLDIDGAQMNATFLSDTGAVRDSFTMIKGSGTPTPTNQPPTVTMASPTAGATFTAPATLTLGASAADADGSVVRVEYYNGSTLLGSSTASPYTLTWSNVPAGSYTLGARAVDNLGAATSSATVGISVLAGTSATPLVTKGSSWKYYTGSTGLASGWALPTVNDSTWPAGNALLGYGAADIATVIPYGPSATNKYITSYFRRSFQVADRTRFTKLLLNLLRDDGAVVYLNGVELARSNMPTGAVTPSVRASLALSGAAETTYYSYTLPTTLLLNGTNVIAVEVHQANPTSSDVRFDLELLGQP